MKKNYFLFIFSLMILFVGCSTLPRNSLHSQTIAKEKRTKTLESDFDVLYTLSYNLTQKAKDDFVSIELDSLLYKARLDFDSYTSFKSILESFFRIVETAKKDNIRNGAGSLGSTELYCFIHSKIDETIERFLIIGGKENHLEFGFLLKENQAYLVLNSFSARPINPKNDFIVYFESVPISLEDAKLLYDFISDEDALEKIRGIDHDEL